jgi:CYTH domain-containing protein
LPNNLDSFKHFEIKQGYITTEGSTIRIRQNGDKYELTKKTPIKENDFSQYEEINIYLTEAEFKKFWILTDKSLEKTRYFISINNNLTAELNVYHGLLDGLAMVEVEFKSESDMNKFIPPDWFGRDVTQEDFSANSFLAGKNYSEIKKFL